MDQPEKEPTFAESVTQVMGTLPPTIRTYLEEEKYTPVAKRLMGRYALRIDQGGVLEREIILLIMGIEDPDEFIGTLTNEAKIPEETAQKIFADVNQEIFVPLRDEMRRVGGVAAQARPPVPPASVSVSKQASPPVPPASAAPRPAPESQPPINLIVKSVTPPVLVVTPTAPVNVIQHPPLVPPPAPKPPTSSSAPKPPAPPPVKPYTTDPYREPIDP
jgi:hypothetical protein